MVPGISNREFTQTHLQSKLRLLNFKIRCHFLPFSTGRKWSMVCPTVCFLARYFALRQTASSDKQSSFSSKSVPKTGHVTTNEPSLTTTKPTVVVEIRECCIYCADGVVCARWQNPSKPRLHWLASIHRMWLSAITGCANNAPGSKLSLPCARCWVMTCPPC